MSRGSKLNLQSVLQRSQNRASKNVFEKSDNKSPNTSPDARQNRWSTLYQQYRTAENSKTPLKTKNGTNMTDNFKEPTRKSVHFQDPQDEFRPDYSLYKDSKEKSIERMHNTLERADVEEDFEYDDSADFADINENIGIPNEGGKKSIRSSIFSVTKGKTTTSTVPRRTEVNRSRVQSGKISSSGFRSNASQSYSRSPKRSATTYVGETRMKPTSSAKFSKTMTIKSNDSLKALAQKLQKYAQLEYEECKLRNRLCEYKNFNIDFAFDLLK